MNERESGAPAGDGHIKVTADGPYLVTGGVPLSIQCVCIDEDGQPHGWKEGRVYLLEESYALCRCGRSAELPFCDGSHSDARFDGTETAAGTPYVDQADELVGPGLKLTDAESFCAHAGFCSRAGGTWNLTRDSGDPTARRTAIEEACECPSGRLVAWEKGDQAGERAIEPEFTPSIGVVADEPGTILGPLWVRGGIPIESAEGTIYEVRNRVTLCGCGRSENKPFCDGSHKD